MSGGGRKRGRTQRRHFKQSRENVWKHDGKTPPSDGPPSSSTDAGGDDSNANTKPNPNPSWQPFATKNANFEEYYKEQRIVSEDEWEKFFSVLQKPLPAAFRVNSSGQFFKDILSQLENEFVESLKTEVENDYEIEAIRPLPWYPGKLAWHLNFSRMQLRKNQTLERFHEFLKLENEVGNITRQEAVSMVPPLFLDVLPDHFILDMCAAPGSKTFQLLEMIHQSTKSGQLPDGLVIANDVDVQRCNLLIHQTKRMCTANLMVTNHEAQHFPTCSLMKNHTENLEGEKGNRKRTLQFDRVLCDVPCSGDGTLRKAPDIWRKWNAGMGNGLHRLQVEIAMRGISLLKVGGRMVYSTCSMNPVENEAVVAEVLRRTGDSVKLLDVSNELPVLVRRPGLKTWKIKDRGIWLVSYKDVPKYRRNVIIPSMFPSGQNHVDGCKHDEAQECIEILSNNVEERNNSCLSSCHLDGENVEHVTVHKNLENNSVTATVEAESKLEASSSGSGAAEVEMSCFPLEHCMRIVPHDQNTGAFFIAVFQKISSISDIPVDLKRQPTSSNYSNSSSLDEKLVESKSEVASFKDTLDCLHRAAGEVVSDADVTVDQPTEQLDVRDMCMTDKESEGMELPDSSKNIDSEVDKTKMKSQIQGRWKGIDPVVFFEDETVINSIRSFYGISESFPLGGQLVTRNSDANHVKRIYYISKAVQDALQLNFQVGQRLKIASLGLKIFERQSSKDGSSNCSFRISSEGLPLLLPYLGKQILYASSVDFKHLLQYRVIKFADFVNSEFREKASSLMSGCCVVVLNEENQSQEIVLDSSMAIVCWKGKTNLSIMLSPLDGKELLERVSARFKGQDDNLAEQNGNDNMDVATLNCSNSENAIVPELADEKDELS